MKKYSRNIAYKKEEITKKNSIRKTFKSGCRFIADKN